VLLSFRVANHRSVREETELSLVATELNEHSARQTGTRSEGRPVAALPAVGIFGANASGKSNVLDALRFMRRAVLESFADWGKRPGVPRQPFALAPEALDETSLFEVELLLGKQRVRYTYGFELRTNASRPSGCTPIRPVAVRCGLTARPAARKQKAANSGSPAAG
jgi:AAA domain, putative AbiEii toxin, Type IV TA system